MRQYKIRLEDAIRLAKESGMSASEFSNHHKTAYAMLLDYGLAEKYLRRTAQGQKVRNTIDKRARYALVDPKPKLPQQWFSPLADLGL